jgi:hypothetical protein
VFLKELHKQVSERLPENKKIFKGLRNIHPRVLLSDKKAPFSNLPLQHIIKNKDQLENQYRNISLHKWKDEDVFKTTFNGTIPQDFAQFWIAIGQYENALGENPYAELSEYALSCLSLPVSNAPVERMFSQVTCVKTKYRNRLSLKTLDAIIRIRDYVQSLDKCCISFTVSKAMLDLFSNDMYMSKQEEQLTENVPYEDDEDPEFVEIIPYLYSCTS